MPQRPPTVPQWAIDAAAGRLVEPVELKRRAGFDPQEQPPAPWMNWMFNLMGAWIERLRSASLANWERRTIPASLFAVAVDDVTVEESTPVRRLVARDDSNQAHVWGSVRGNEWVSLPVNVASGTCGDPRNVVFTGTHWLLLCANHSTSNAQLWSTPAGGGAIYDPTLNWNPVTLPATTSEIDVLGVRRDPGTGAPLEMVALSRTKILYATSVSSTIAFDNASTVGTPAGVFVDVCWTGQRWVALTSTGEVWTCVTSSGTWTKAATLTTTSPPYGRGLASDGLGTVLAYPGLQTSPDAWWVSADFGATWSAQTAPTGLVNITRVRVIGNEWIMTSSSAPYLASANAPDATSWLRLPVPIPDTFLSTPINYALHDLAYVDGAFVAIGNSHWLLSRRAEDVSPGTYQPSVAPLYLHDAAYLRGRLITGATPADGNTLVWNAAEDQIDWGTAGLSNTINSTFAFGGGLHDYRIDADFDTTTAGFAGPAMASSLVLGDGTSVPRFYAWARTAVTHMAICQRTAGGTLRIGPDDTIANTDCYPFGYIGCVAAIPLPDAIQLTVDFVLSSNVGGGVTASTTWRGFVSLLGLQGVGGIAQYGYVGFDSAGGAINETYNGPASTASRSGETTALANAGLVSAGVATRRYLIVIDGPTVQIFAAPTSSPLGTPTVALGAAWDLTFLQMGLRRWLVLSSNGGGTAGTNGQYAEISALTVNGVRAFM